MRRPSLLYATSFWLNNCPIDEDEDEDGDHSDNDDDDDSREICSLLINILTKD